MKKRSKSRKTWMALTAAVAAAAVVKELRTPKSERTWHGVLGGFVPYDFRTPTWERVKATVWNPEGPLVVGRAFGVGWTLNVGGLVARLRASS